MHKQHSIFYDKSDFSFRRSIQNTLRHEETPRILLRRRLTGCRKKEKRSITEFSGCWHGNDIDEVFTTVLKDREQSKAREVNFDKNRH